jgi:hypothetical protein
VDARGNEQFKQCFYVPELTHGNYVPWNFVQVKRDKLLVRGDAGQRYNIPINLTNLPTDRLDQVKITIVRGSTSSNGITC